MFPLSSHQIFRGKNRDKNGARCGRPILKAALDSWRKYFQSLSETGWRPATLCKSSGCVTTVDKNNYSVHVDCFFCRFVQWILLSQFITYCELVREFTHGCICKNVLIYVVYVEMYSRGFAEMLLAFFDFFLKQKPITGEYYSA